MKLINDKGTFEKSSENPENGNCLPQEVGSSTLRWVSGDKLDRNWKEGYKIKKEGYKINKFKWIEWWLVLVTHKSL